MASKLKTIATHLGAVVSVLGPALVGLSGAGGKAGLYATLALQALVALGLYRANSAPVSK